jgi:hypothetical protein
MSEETIFVTALEKTDPAERAAYLEGRSIQEGQTAFLGPDLVGPTSRARGAATDRIRPCPDWTDPR